MAPESGWLEDEFPFGKPYFQGRTVSLKEGKYKKNPSIGLLKKGGKQWQATNQFLAVHRSQGYYSEPSLHMGNGCGLSL